MKERCLTASMGEFLNGGRVVSDKEIVCGENGVCSDHSRPKRLVQVFRFNSKFNRKLGI